MFILKETDTATNETREILVSTYEVDIDHYDASVQWTQVPPEIQTLIDKHDMKMQVEEPLTVLKSAVSCFMIKDSDYSSACKDLNMQGDNQFAAKIKELARF